MPHVRTISLVRVAVQEPLVTLSSVFALAVAPIFLVGGSLPSLTVWVLVALGIRSAANFMGRNLEPQERRYYRRVGLFAFGVISFVGSVMVFDNISNFGEPFYSAHDDSDFYYTIKGIVLGESVEIEKWVFEHFFAVVYLILVPLHLSLDVHFLSLLTVSWGFAAFSVVLISRTVFLLTKVQMPFWLLAISLLGNYAFVRNSVLFYREAFMLCLAFSALNAFLDKRNTKGLIYTVVTGLVRGFNAALILIYELLNIATYRWGSRRRVRYGIFISLILIAGAVALNALDSRGNVLIAVAKPFTQSGHYANVYEGFTLQEWRELRAYDPDERSTGAQIASRFPEPVKVAIDAVMYLFYPIAFHPPETSRAHNSVTKRVYVEDGFFVFNILEWISVLCWFVTIPLLVLSIFRISFVSVEIKNLFVLYLTGLLLISIFRGHQRHVLFLVALNPVFVTVAWQHYLASGKTQAYRLVQVFVVIGIVGYNTYKYIL